MEETILFETGRGLDDGTLSAASDWASSHQHWYSPVCRLQSFPLNNTVDGKSAESVPSCNDEVSRVCRSMCLVVVSADQLVFSSVCSQVSQPSPTGRVVGS